MFDPLLAVGEGLVEDVTLALDGEPQGLHARREEADDDAGDDGDVCVAHGGGRAGGRGGECERVEMESEQVEMSGGRRDGWSEREHDWNGRLSAC